MFIVKIGPKSRHSTHTFSLHSVSRSPLRARFQSCITLCLAIRPVSQRARYGGGGGGGGGLFKPELREHDYCLPFQVHSGTAPVVSTSTQTCPAAGGGDSRVFD